MGKMTDDEVAQIGRALGDPNRLAIYTQIAQNDELFCGEMHAKHTISAPTLSPTEKSINPTGGNLFTPPVKAPAAPTAIPGDN